MAFDFDGVFDKEHYLYFMGPLLDGIAADQDAGTIWELAGLKEASAVLDLACGHGRIANRLADKGALVTGLDRSDDFLVLARAAAGARGVTVNYVQGDMRKVPWIGTFDLVLSWFTSYGYFDDADNRKVLREAHRALRPGGMLLVDLVNRDWMLKNFQASIVVERDDNLMVDRNHFDPKTGRTLTERTVHRDGKVHRFKYQVRHFTFVEVRDWLADVGFVDIEPFDRGGGPYTLDSRRLILRATRPTDA